MSFEGQWRWAAASVVGTTHRATGTVCQDAHAVAVRPDGALVAAVADGAGSARHSARGAAAAVAAAVGTLVRRGGESGAGGGLRMGDAASNDDVGGSRESDVDVMAAALQAAGAAIDVLANADGLSPRDLACTLSCVIARRDGVLAAQIGDGLVVAVGPDGVATALTVPERGDYANETTFLTSPGAIDAALAGMRQADGTFDAVVLLTDGLLRLALDLATSEPHAAFFGPLVRFAAAADDADAAAAQLAAFLESPRVRTRTDDDLTLIVAARGSAHGSAPGSAR